MAKTPELVPAFTPDPAVFGPDYQPPQITKRHAVANEVADMVKRIDCAQVYGGEAVRDPDGKFYGIKYSRTGTVDGHIAVYGEDYLLVFWTGAEDPLPYEGKKLLASVAQVEAFLRLAFLENQPVFAMSMPERQPKRSKRRDQDEGTSWLPF